MAGAADYKISLGGVQKIDAPGGKIQFVAAPDSYTKILLHFDGTNTSQTFIDSGASNYTLSAVGTAQLDVSQKKFGTASLLLDGDSDYATVPDSDDWDFGTNNFTVDFWAYIANTNKQNMFVSLGYNSANSLIVYYQDAKLSAIYRNAALNNKTIVGSALTQNTWYHIALIKNNNYLILYLDGVTNGSYAPMQTNTVHADHIDIGYAMPRDQTLAYMQGNIDEMRISKGIARWTNNFTPPTRSYGE